MPATELAHLELLAEVDALNAELERWSSDAPDWPPARQAQMLVKRLTQRAGTLKVRLDAPLIVATLGGTGTGKSTLVNALAGQEVTQAGQQRPTTRLPTLICRPDLSCEQLGIDPRSVHLVQRDLPSLRDLVLLDCPDPDTTEDAGAGGTNLARLRELLPHCDVLLVTATQQKYRSARVGRELAAAAPGARLVFVQTHADRDTDIRQDWRRMLAEEHAASEIFFVDSRAALADALAGLNPRGEFARLVQFFEREMAGAAAKRIRRANFLDLIADTLARCRQKLDDGLPAVEHLETALAEQRGRLTERLARQMRDELLGSRRLWENRLLGEIAARWGFSPFSCVLRLHQGVGGLLAASALTRARTPAQMALWGALEGGRRLRNRRHEQRAEAAPERALAQGWDETELRTAAIIIDGYAAEAGLPRQSIQPDKIEREAANGGASFVAEVARELQALVTSQAKRHTGWWVRWRYELALLAMLGLILYRLGRNFFYDSWLAVDLGLTSERQPVHGTDFFVGAGFWLLLWCGLLLWAFTSRLRRGLESEISALAQRWTNPKLACGIFAGLDAECRRVHRFRDELERLSAQIAALRQTLSVAAPVANEPPLDASKTG